MANPRNTATLEDFIEAGDSVTDTYANFSMIDESKNTKIPIYNVISDYMQELQALSVTIELKPEEYVRFRFKPKLLADYLYGNSELYFVILLLNNMCSVKEFDLKKVKLLKKEDMNALISNIYNSEKDFLRQYNDKEERL